MVDGLHLWVLAKMDTKMLSNYSVLTCYLYFLNNFNRSCTFIMYPILNFRAKNVRNIAFFRPDIFHFPVHLNNNFLVCKQFKLQDFFNCRLKTCKASLRQRKKIEDFCVYHNGAEALFEVIAFFYEANKDKRDYMWLVQDSSESIM